MRYLSNQMRAEQAEHLLNVPQFVVWGGRWFCCSLDHLGISPWAGVWLLLLWMGWGHEGQEWLWTSLMEVSLVVSY